MKNKLQFIPIDGRSTFRLLFINDHRSFTPRAFSLLVLVLVLFLALRLLALLRRRPFRLSSTCTCRIASRDHWSDKYTQILTRLDASLQKLQQPPEQVCIDGRQLARLFRPAPFCNLLQRLDELTHDVRVKTWMAPVVVAWRKEAEGRV